MAGGLPCFASPAGVDPVNMAGGLPVFALLAGVDPVYIAGSGTSCV